MGKFLIAFLFLYSIMLPQTWQHFNTSNSALPGNKINSIIFGSDGTTWVATDNGLAAYKNDVWTPYSTTDGLSSNLVKALLLMTSENKLWLGTDAGSTDFSVSENQITSEAEYFNTSNSNIISDNILCMGLDKRSNIWMGTNRGISVLLQSGIRNITVGDPNVGDGLKSNYISGFSMDTDGQVNVATAGGGVSRFNINDVDGISSASIIENTWSRLPSDSVFAIHIGSDNIRWIGTNQGLVTCIGEDSKNTDNWLSYYYTGNGLINDRVTSITEDNFGNKWVGTIGGVAYFNGSEWHSFTTDNGLISNNILTIAVDPANNIWIGSDAGLTKLSDFVVDIENNELPEEYSLDVSVYPNPFNPSTNINFDIAEDDNIKLIIYDAAGRRVRTLINTFCRKGNYQTRWNGFNSNGSQMTSGVYFVSLQSSTSSLTKKIILLR